MRLKFKKENKDGTVKVKKAIGKKKKITVLISAVLVFVIAGGVCFSVFGKKKQTEKINTAKADTGDIALTISGTGTIEANEQYNVTSLVKGEITSAPFEEGDTVKKGDLLYKIDTTDIENNIAKSKLSVEKSQNTYSQNVKELSKLTITAPISGNISELYVESGDTVGANSKIADITDTSKMTLTVPFIDEHTAGVSAGMTAEVTLQNTNDTVTGTVERITTGTYVNSAGVTVRDVEIAIDNPGSVKEGDKATAIVGDTACSDSGTFKNYGSKTVYSEISGTVASLSYKKGDRVTSGSVIAKLTSDSLQQNITSNELSLRESKLSLQNTYNELDNYSITSPISGTVIQKTSKQGDTLDNTNSSVTMAVIADMSKILFTMSIDELDISKIKVGQEVSITADALPDEKFSGYVESVSIVGTSSNGVTTYPVTVVVNDPKDLIPGMNVSAEITVEKKENVIRVPVSAVRRGDTVAMKSDKATAKDEESTDENDKKPTLGGNIPDGFVSVPVKTGINDDTYIEIISGISAGDEVWIPAVSNNSSNTNTQQGGMPGGGEMPGGGGGMPGGGGGAPGGGGPGR